MKGNETTEYEAEAARFPETLGRNANDFASKSVIGLASAGCKEPSGK